MEETQNSHQQHGWLLVLILLFFCNPKWQLPGRSVQANYAKQLTEVRFTCRHRAQNWKVVWWTGEQWGDPFSKLSSVFKKTQNNRPPPPKLQLSQLLQNFWIFILLVLLCLLLSVAAAALAGVFCLPNMAVAVLGALMTLQLRFKLRRDGEMENPLLISVESSWLIFREEGWGKGFVPSLLAGDFFFFFFPKG